MPWWIIFWLLSFVPMYRQPLPVTPVYWTNQQPVPVHPTPVAIIMPPCVMTSPTSGYCAATPGYVR